MTLEGKVKEEVKVYLDSLGPDCWYYCPVPMGYGKRGVPDFIICYKGFFLAPETKKRGGKNEPWQETQQEAIQRAGGKSGRITNVLQLQGMIKEIDERIARATPAR